MVSEKMIEDAEDLAVRGIQLTPREVVRLNALGLKAERGPLSSALFTMPRACMLGGLVFREPTLGHELWLDEVGRFYDLDDGMTSFVVTALCYSARSAADLPRWEDREQFLGHLRSFATGELSAHTVREVVACVRYVRDGGDPTFGEYGPKRPNEAADDEIDLGSFSASVGIIHEGQSLALGIPLADALRMTRPALRRVIDRAYKMMDRDLEKTDVQDAVGDYDVALDEIISRHEKEATQNGG